MTIANRYIMSTFVFFAAGIGMTTRPFTVLQKMGLLIRPFLDCIVNVNNNCWLDCKQPISIMQFCFFPFPFLLFLFSLPSALTLPANFLTLPPFLPIFFGARQQNLCCHCQCQCQCLPVVVFPFPGALFPFPTFFLSSNNNSLIIDF